METITKQCSKCKEIKEIEYFSIFKTGKYGRSSVCKKCAIEYAKKYREENATLIKNNSTKYYVENKDKIQEKNKIYHTENKENIKEKKVIYNLRNKENIKIKQKEYRNINKEKISERVKSYLEKNKEIIKEKTRVYYQKNKSIITKNLREKYLISPEKAKQYSSEYRKTEKGKISKKNNTNKRRDIKNNGNVKTDELLYLQRNSKVCYWCGIDLKNKKTHIDHYEPLSKGGAHTISNLVISCAKCNLVKHTTDPYKFANSVGKLF